MIYLFFGLLVTIAKIIAHVSMLGVFAESKQWYKKYKYIYIPLTSIGCYLITVWLDEYMYIKFAVMFLIFVSDKFRISIDFFCLRLKFS